MEVIDTYKEEYLKKDEENANDLIHGVEIGDAETSTTVPDIHMFQLARRPSRGRRADVGCQFQVGFHRLLFLALSLSGCYTAAVLQQVEFILGQ